MNSWEEYFFVRDNYESRRDLSYTSASFNLDKAAELYTLAGKPAQTIPKIHIAGTNGKGSTCLFLEQIALAANTSTGVFLSPHVEHPGERIRINGRNSDQSALASAANWLQGRIPESTRPTTFELLFLAALYLFEQAGLKIIILETGVGGRLDTTNIITPLVSVITPISLDHTALLGPDLASIAREKAGIIKTGVPLIQAFQFAEVDEVLAASCLQKQTPRQIARAHSTRELGLKGTELVREDGSRWRTCLCGREQAENLELAFVTASLLGLDFDKENLARRLARARLPARLEVFGAGSPIIIDGGHNPQAIARLGGILVRSGYRADKKILVIVGMMADKDCAANLEEIDAWADEIMAVDLPSPRAASAAHLASLLPEGRVTTCTDARQAITTSLAQRASDTALVIIGSFILAGIARPVIMAQSR